MRIPANFRNHAEAAKRYQAGICWLPTDNFVDRLFQVCASGLAVFLGNKTKVGGSVTDSNGMRLARLAGTWNHATSAAAYKRVNGTEYIFWVNSHGPRYTAKDLFNAPMDGAWMDRKTTTSFLSTAARYGRPGIVIPESVPVEWDSFEPIVRAKHAS